MAYRDQQFIALQRMQKVKQSAPDTPQKIGQDMVGFFREVEKRQNKLGKIAQAWAELVEEKLCEHCCLESLFKGTLTVIVDSSAHLYQLKQLLLDGVEKQLIARCKSSRLRKVALKPGRWYNGDVPGDRKIRF
jgi:hypothetical protein